MPFFALNDRCRGTLFIYFHNLLPALRLANFRCRVFCCRAAALLAAAPRSCRAWVGVAGRWGRWLCLSSPVAPAPSAVAFAARQCLYAWPWIAGIAWVWPPAFSKTCRIGLQNGPFGLAKRPVSQANTGRFAAGQARRRICCGHRWRPLTAPAAVIRWASGGCEVGLPARNRPRGRARLGGGCEPM